jgi:hypothetical protein
MNKNRIGNFTSSEIVALMSNGREKGSLGAPAKTYIKEKNRERRLGRSISPETDARPTSWGKHLERRAFDILGLDYSLTSDKTFAHPTVECWVGSPDGFHHRNGQFGVIDFKAPFTLKSFCQLVDSFNEGGIDALRAEHKDGEKYYFQIVSNACITGAKWGELIVYMPYESELDTIRQASEGNPDLYWLWSAPNEKLPYLVDGGYYKNINVLQFDIPASDKLALHERVVQAKSQLIEIPSLIKAA